jgi:hypothetical protein
MRRTIGALIFFASFGALAESCSLVLDTGALNRGQVADGGQPQDGSIGDVGIEDAPDAEDALDSGTADGPFALGCDAGGLVAAWMFDEGEGGVANDCTGHGYTARFVGDAGWASGRDGGASLDLHKSGYADCDDPGGGLRFGGSMTVAAWVWVRDFSNNGRIFTLSTSSTSRSFELTAENSLQPPVGHLSMIVYGIASDSSPVYQAANTPQDDAGLLSPGTWRHVAGVYVYPAGTILIFLNGAQVGVFSNAGPRHEDGDPIRIGQRDTASEAFDGMIDELRFYNRALPLGEIQALAAQ